MKKTLILALCAAAVMVACGGGGDDTPAPAPTAEVPAAASVTVTALISYLRALVVADADTLEPVDVSVVTPPTDDAGEPSSVD